MRTSEVKCAAIAGVVAVSAIAIHFRRRWRRRRELPRLLTEVPGPKSQALVSRLALHECPAITARRARRADELGAAATDPIVWASAEGALVTDADGNTFLDFCSGFGVATLGHACPEVCAAARQMLERPLIHAMGDAFADASRVELLELLASFLPALPKGILGCSGADAVQAALKTAALATSRQGVLAFSGGYHGLAHGALASTAYHAESFRKPFAVQLGDFVTFAEFGAQPFPPLKSASPPIGAVIVEPIQGRGGIRDPGAAWLRALRAHCDAEGALLIYDEIYTGWGRTGQWFAFQAVTETDSGEGAAVGGAPLPDLICLGKAMGGGFPISVCLGTKHAMDAWGASRGESLHTQTFLGNPLGCAMACAALRELRRMDAPSVARAKGATLVGMLTRAGLNARDGAVRGRGMMLAVQVADPLHAMSSLLRQGVLALPCGEGRDFAMALIPPLVATDAQLQFCVDALVAACAEAAAKEAL